MGVVDDMLSADRIPIWKRLHQVPEEVDDLKHASARLRKSSEESGQLMYAALAGSGRLGLSVLRHPTSRETCVKTGRVPNAIPTM